jgi:hypothetical protein
MTISAVLLRGAVVLLCTALAAELVARAFGLGDPPLLVDDPLAEYRYAPSTSYRRFGNEISYNRWSMRSPDFPARKAFAGEQRVLVIGDSVVNGGTLTDQASIATSLLQAGLGSSFTVGNISAWSWGPANQLGYIHEFGWFDADIVILVTSVRDLTDVPTFDAKPDPDLPRVKPPFALWEVATRYLPRYLPTFRLSSPGAARSGSRTDPAFVQAASASLAALLLEAKHQADGRVAILHHHAIDEEDDMTRHLAGVLSALAADQGIAVLEMNDVLGKGDQARRFYRDDIHLSADGQAAYATVMECVVRAFEADQSVQPCAREEAAR